jgi:hypothetical protein
MTLGWHFPPTGGGDTFGIHNAGIEAFKPVIQALVREMGQNTGDAPDGSGLPVLLTFKREVVKRSEIAGLSDLQNRFIMCRKFWDDPDPEKADTAAVDFFDNSLFLISKPTIECLRVSDYFTTGVPGSDKDKSSGWFKLAKSNGTTTKASASGAGGSFGIGKIAALAASQFRTVYYSTLTDEGYNFIGSTMLTTHEDPSGTSYQPKSYFGHPGGFSVSEKSVIPEMFRRNTVGLDVFITAFDFGENWEEDIAAVVIGNFWPAILWEKFECEVGEGSKKIAINNKTLVSLLAKYSEREGFLAHLYHKAYTEGLRHDDTMPNLCGCSAHIIAGEGYPKKVAMIRKNGMVIEERAFSSRTPFVGVFECSNDDGNRILRSMEPPRHDRWDPNLPEKKANTAAEKEFKRVVYDAIKEINTVKNVETGVVTGLEELLPFDENINDVNVPNAKRPTYNHAEKPRQTSVRATIPRAGEPRRKSKKKKDKVSHIEIMPRAIKTAEGYTIKVRHSGDPATNAFVEVNIAGDGMPEIATITSATDSSGKDIPILGSRNCFGPVTLNKTNSFDIKLATKRRVSLEVSAYHEA